ncbi:thiol reductant ABC exporter subunit CydD [Streptomyces sp. TP-A0874]|uniref:thiol reductant ABC exporter subunit CydD n=1 Tax=Streptomyces sp. TP-A0874 TaxID=549819 RepID=UPI000852CF6B|nr:thiol reductant ABC exporter subunit CydD [Streptomyces sp. TP-A0874]
MKPVDPRLLRHARATRVFLAASIALGLAGAGLVIAQATLIAEVVVLAFQQNQGTAAVRTPLLLLAAVSVGRAAVVWLTELAAHRASAAVKSELRVRLLEHAGRLGPGWLSRQRTGELTLLATRGVEALDDYFARYLPQLGLAVAVPAAVLARIVTADWVSAAVIAATLPLIPLFMVLVGWTTQASVDRQWRLLSRLSGHFLDVLAGLPTLKVFGRARAQAQTIRAVTADYRRATLRTLRIAFLSSFVLELLATLSVALVAVGIGMRLVHGELDLRTGLVVLILAPEAYLPLRQVGTHYHAAAEGLAAADEVFAVLEARPERPEGHRPAPDASQVRLAVEGLAVHHPGRDRAALPPTSLAIRPGETVAVVGPSGAGKTTLLNALLGFATPTAGRITLTPTGRPEDGDGIDLAQIAPEGWRGQIAWVPQHPHLFAGTIAENVRLARPDASAVEVLGALRQAAALDFVTALPDGVDTLLGEGGTGLSAGQRQRIALARAFLADRPLLLLDEPTANLDGGTESAVVAAIGRLARGRTVLMTAHRPALLALADRVVRLEPDPEPADRLAAVPGPQPRPGNGKGAEAPGASEAAAGRAPDRPGPAPSAPLRWLRATARPRIGRFTLALLLGTLALGSAVGLMATSGWLISRASQQPPLLYLMLAVTATRAFGIGRAVFRYAERLVGHDAVLRLLADLRVTVYRGLERLAPAGLGRSRRGDLLSRLVADVDAAQDYFLRWLLPVGSALLVGLATTGFVGWLLPAAGVLTAAGLLAAGGAAPALAALATRREQRQLAPARGALSARVVDLLTGAGELAVAGALGGRTAEARRADARLTALTSRSAAAAGVGGALATLAGGLTVAAAGWVGTAAVSEGRLAGVELAVVMLTPLAAFESVSGLPLAVRYRQRAGRAAARIRELLDQPVPVRPPRCPAEPPSSPFPLTVRGLGARHQGQHRPALRDFDLDLSPGRRIAVVGPSGAGKTTLAQLLLRFLEPEAGTYTLAGTPAGELDDDAVRRLVGLLAQDAHIFDSTLRENLRLARPTAGDGELRAALASARLLDWVDGLPQGLDTFVGEHGARLSGGQRRRLALARALLADFPVLVLDEPAEHLDPPTADALTADLLAATAGRTTLLITHRLAGLEAVDEVVVLDGGRTVQRGRYAELAAVDGPFRRMLEGERAADRVASAVERTALAEQPPPFATPATGA